jgi:hypothetical protein
VKVKGSWLATRGREREGERVNLVRFVSRGASQCECRYGVYILSRQSLEDRRLLVVRVTDTQIEHLVEASRT